MASEQPEVEAAAGVVEEIRDLSELSSLEEQQSQLVQLVQGFTENQENLGSVYKQVQNALRGAGTVGASICDAPQSRRCPNGFCNQPSL